MSYPAPPVTQRVARMVSVDAVTVAFMIGTVLGWLACFAVSHLG